LSPARPTVVHLGYANGPTLLVGQHRNREDAIAGEETALVRPYVLASEERAWRGSTAAPNGLFTYTCYAPKVAL
jgi:hypothetical protein